MNWRLEHSHCIYFYNNWFHHLFIHLCQEQVKCQLFLLFRVHSFLGLASDSGRSELLWCEVKHFVGMFENAAHTNTHTRTYTRIHLSRAGAAEQVTKVSQQTAVQAVWQLKDIWHLASTLLSLCLSLSRSHSLCLCLYLCNVSLQFVELLCVGASNVAIGRTLSKVFCESAYVCWLIWWLLLMQLALLLLFCCSSSTLHSALCTLHIVLHPLLFMSSLSLPWHGCSIQNFWPPLSRAGGGGIVLHGDNRAGRVEGVVSRT